VQYLNITALGGAGFINGPPYGLHVANGTLIASLEGNLGLFQFGLDDVGFPTLLFTYTVPGGAFCSAFGGVADTSVVATTSGSSTQPLNTWTRPLSGSSVWTSDGTDSTGVASYDLQVTPDGSLLIQGTSSKNVKVYTAGPAGTYTLSSTTTVPITFGYSSVAFNLLSGNETFYHFQQGSVGPTPRPAILFQYAINGASLTPLTPLNITIPVLPTDYKFSPDQKFLYVLGLDNQCTVAQGSRATDGTITFGPTYPSAATAPCEALRISADGAWVFLTGNDGTIYQFSRDSTSGNLSPLPCASFANMCPPGMRAVAANTYPTNSTNILAFYTGCQSVSLTSLAVVQFSTVPITNPPPCPTSSPTPHPTATPTASPSTLAPTRTPTHSPTRHHLTSALAREAFL